MVSFPSSPSYQLSSQRPPPLQEQPFQQMMPQLVRVLSLLQFISAYKLLLLFVQQAAQSQLQELVAFLTSLAYLIFLCQAVQVHPSRALALLSLVQALPSWVPVQTCLLGSLVMGLTCKFHQEHSQGLLRPSKPSFCQLELFVQLISELPALGQPTPYLSCLVPLGPFFVPLLPLPQPSICQPTHLIYV